MPTELTNLDSIKQLPISRTTLNDITSYEVGSEQDYKKLYSHPEYPGLNSGVTIGIGCDLGYNNKAQIQDLWGGLVSNSVLDRLKAASGIKGQMAAKLIPGMKDITIPFEVANKVFLEKTLPRFAKEALRTYPGLEKLYPDTIGAIISLVFNRGTRLDGPTRTEMADLVALIANQDYGGIAAKIKEMKRLWDGIQDQGNTGTPEKRVKGLLLRRDKEADRVLNSNRAYKPDEILYIPLS